MALFELKIEIFPGDAEKVDDVLLEQGMGNWSVLENMEVQRAWIIGICENEAEADRQWRNVTTALTAAGVVPLADPTRRDLGDADWRESYRAHFHAWQFGRLHWVPVWERDTFALPEGDAVLWLDPGLAFGTGNHESTRLCVERLVTLAEEKESQGRVVDAGCGSGILALSAALLGYSDVRGFDNDPEAVRISKENAVLNGMAGRVAFHLADLSAGLAGLDSAVDVLMANIQADVLMRHARELVAAVAPGGSLVLSGILADENSVVRAKFEEHAPKWSVNARVMDDWSDIVMTRPGDENQGTGVRGQRSEVRGQGSEDG